MFTAGSGVLDWKGFLRRENSDIQVVRRKRTCQHHAGVMDKPPYCHRCGRVRPFCPYAPQKRNPGGQSPPGLTAGKLHLPSVLAEGVGCLSSLEATDCSRWGQWAAAPLCWLYAGRDDRQPQITLESLAHQAFTHVVTWGFSSYRESCLREDRHSRAHRRTADQRYFIPDHRQDLSQIEAGASKL